MATVDSSVGGKTGVNHPLGKNMIGAFYQPQCVLIDTQLLDSLPRREHASGISEIVKYGLIRDPELFHWLEDNMEALLDKDPEVSSRPDAPKHLSKASATMMTLCHSLRSLLMRISRNTPSFTSA